MILILVISSVRHVFSALPAHAVLSARIGIALAINSEKRVPD